MINQVRAIKGRDNKEGLINEIMDIIKYGIDDDYKVKYVDNADVLIDIYNKVVEQDLVKECAVELITISIDKEYTSKGKKIQQTVIKLINLTQRYENVITLEYFEEEVGKNLDVGLYIDVAKGEIEEEDYEEYKGEYNLELYGEVSNAEMDKGDKLSIREIEEALRGYTVTKEDKLNLVMLNVDDAGGAIGDIKVGCSKYKSYGEREHEDLGEEIISEISKMLQISIREVREEYDKKVGGYNKKVNLLDMYGTYINISYKEYENGGIKGVQVSVYNHKKYIKFSVSVGGKGCVKIGLNELGVIDEKVYKNLQKINGEKLKRYVKVAGIEEISEVMELMLRSYVSDEEGLKGAIQVIAGISKGGINWYGYSYRYKDK